MANVAIYDPADPIVANKITTYLLSVNTPDYVATPNALINPPIPEGVPMKYWKRSAGQVVEMTSGEKAAIDAYEAAQAAEALDNAKDITISLDKLTKAFALVVLDEINVLRDEHGLSQRTVNQLRDAVKAKYE